MFENPFAPHDLYLFRLQELKRDVQARLLTVETYGGETFLSEDVAISILQETKNAFNRASQVLFVPM